MKLTEKSNEVFNYVKQNGRVSIDELVEALGRPSRSINANVTDLTKKKLCVREKVAGEGDKEITYVLVTPDADALLAAEE